MERKSMDEVVSNISELQEKMIRCISNAQIDFNKSVKNSNKEAQELKKILSDEFNLRSDGNLAPSDIIQLIHMVVARMFEEKECKKCH